jgi:hypothetical protein
MVTTDGGIDGRFRDANASYTRLTQQHLPGKGVFGGPTRTPAIRRISPDSGEVALPRELATKRDLAALV